MSTTLTPLIDIMPDAIPEEMAHMLFFGFTVQRMALFQEKECWTLLLTSEMAEFFHWHKEEKHFVIPRSQASQTIYITNRQQANHLIMVKRPSAHFCFFKVAAANGETLQDWLGVATAKRGPGAFISNLYELIYRPVLQLS
jgi:hypothetical protein